MNDVTIRLIARVDAWTTALQGEEGSQGLEAAGAALAAAAIVGMLLKGANFLGAAVDKAFQTAAKAIGG